MNPDELSREIAARARFDEFQLYLPRMSQLLNEELSRAIQEYGSFNSMHEGYAILLKEMDELWDEIKKKSDVRNPGLIQKEAIQVAAMACRLVVDIIMQRRF